MNKKPKVLVLDTIADAGIQKLKKFAEIIDGRALDFEQIKKAISPCQGIVLKSNNWITKDILENAPQLKVIGRAGSGTENIDLKEAEKRNIRVICSPEGNVTSVAEYVISTSILLLHQLHEANAGSKRNDFRRHIWQGKNLHNCVIGVIGLGNIGKGVVEKMAHLSKEVIGFDPFFTGENHTFPDNFRQVQNIDEIYKVSDVITLHLPLTNESEYMLNDHVFSLMKPGVILINSSRGRLIDDQALLNALDCGKVAAAALDSLYPDPEYNKKPEQSTYSHFWINHPKIFYTPHIAAGTVDALTEVAVNLVEKMKIFFEQE